MHATIAAASAAQPSASGNSRSAAMTLAKTVKGASTTSAAGECLARSRVVSSIPPAAAWPSTAAAAANTPRKAAAGHG